MRMTFEAFQSTRQHGDLRPLLEEQGNEPYGTKLQTGYRYCERLHIEDVMSWWPERSRAEGRYYLMLGNQEFITNDLELLEFHLFRFARDNGYDVGLDSQRQESALGPDARVQIEDLNDGRTIDRRACRDWLTKVARHIGLGFHPDTRGADYVKDGQRSFSDGDAHRYDAGLEICAHELGDLSVVGLCSLLEGRDLWNMLYEDLVTCPHDNVELVERGGKVAAVTFSTEAWLGEVSDHVVARCDVRVALRDPDDDEREVAMLRCHPSEMLATIATLVSMLETQ